MLEQPIDSILFILCQSVHFVMAFKSQYTHPASAHPASAHPTFASEFQTNPRNNVPHSQTMQVQDDLLEVVAGQVKTIKKIGEDVGAELNRQEETTDQIGTTINIADPLLTRTTDRAGRLVEKTSENWFCITFIILAVVIVLMVIFEIK